MATAVNLRRMLRHYRASNKPRKLIISCDIETNGLGGAFIIGAYIREGETEIHYFHSPEEWLKEIFHRDNYGYIWYAHNGGEYDYKYLIEPLIKHCADTPGMRVNVIRQGIGKVIGFVIRYQKMRFEMRDSIALITSSLKDITSKFAPEWAKLDIGLADNVTFDPKNAEHMKYLYYDVRGLLESLIVFDKIVWDTFHVRAGWAIASTAMRAWQTTIPQSDCYWRMPQHAEDFIRNAYYGGLVFLTSNAWQEDCTSIDVNSMYPSVMRDYGVPVGAAVYTEKYRAKPGFYHVIAECPEDQEFTFIPERDRNLVWPTGTFETWISTYEIENAKARGYTFQIIDGYVFSHEKKIFDVFINKCEELRIKHKGTALEATVKIMQNGLYGKFGSNDTVDSYILAEYADVSKGFTPVIDMHTGEVIEHLYSHQEILDVPFIHPEWAAWITSHARIRLLEYIEAIGAENVFYGDTDSITAKTHAVQEALNENRMTIGITYGLIKIEKEYIRFRASGPKNYQGLTENGYIDKAKGMPRRYVNPQDHERAMNGEKVTIDITGMSGTLSVIKHNASFAKSGTRSYSLLENSAGWRVTHDGIVRPIHRSPTTDIQQHIRNAHA